MFVLRTVDKLCKQFLLTGKRNQNVNVLCSRWNTKFSIFHTVGFITSFFES